MILIKGRFSKRVLAKFLVLLVFIFSAFGLYHFTCLKDFVSPQVLTDFIIGAGGWAPVLFVVAEALAITLFVPASVMIILGAGLFGAYKGFLYAWLGAWLGAGCAFLVGRMLGREFVAAMMGKRLKKYDDAIERNGFITVLYIRLLNAPFTPMNYGLSLTKVGFRDFFLGTGFGVMVSVFAITFLSGMIREVWISGRWGDLLAPKMFLGVGIYIFSFFIPVILKRLKR